MDDCTEPHWESSALLTIDVQRDFSLPSSPTYIEGTGEAVSAMRPLVLDYRAQDRPIVHVVRLYLPDGSNVDPCRRNRVATGERLLVPGSLGTELVEELAPTPDTRLDVDLLLAGGLQQFGSMEWAIYKPRWGAFFGTRLEEHLGTLGVDTLVIAGCNFPNCPRSTIYEASERDFRLVVVGDAVSGIYEKGIEELKGIGAAVLDARECLESLAVARTQANPQRAGG